MSIVKEKYLNLAPRAEYLHDIVVLAQAWKKSHTYIRRHNWYADTLELDCSAVDLDNKLGEWSASLLQGDYRTKPACVVPAPKNAPWVFSESLPGGWGPKVGSAGSVLRPLAHLGIREQTVATALMLCLADCIETAQGNPAETPEQAVVKGVYSYGNRLYCNWSSEGSRARFSWGNSNTYSRYFQDYQQFVVRPNAMARIVHTQKADDELVYIVKLDLSAFYDNVDVDRLVTCLQREYTAFRKSDKSLLASDAAFWRLARQVLSFSWREQDKTLGHLFRDEKLPDGLPQGLVASGFFANAYMLDFDRAIGAASKDISRIEGDFEIRIHDYCRYVDDLRLVVSVKATEADESKVAQTIAKWIQGYLDNFTSVKSEQTSRLHVNSEKTELELYSSVGGESGIAASMKAMQQQLSGPFDLATLQQVETGLNGLLALAELGLKEELPSASSNSLPMLAAVARPKLEVRDDTLTRFSAYRLTKSLRMRRSMTDLSEKNGEVSAKDALLHDFEVIARRLVAAWAVNPSLVQVLRYALDLYPSPDLLAPVADALTRKLMVDEMTPKDERVIFYVLAELFKAGATETGQRATHDAGFQVGDVGEYRVSLVGLAQTVLEMPDVPWYVQQQAALLFATVGHSTDVLSSGDELRFHRTLHEFLRTESKSRCISPESVTSNPPANISI